MKTDVQAANESVTPSGKAIEILKKYFPQCFDKTETDDNGNIIKEHFDTEKLAGLLSDNVEIKKEGFTLNFLGKSYARYQSNLDSETVIVPDEENDKNDSENVYIVGDNLDALQHLKYSYAEKIKCIYIDPPYNTGKEDFVYNDKFGYTSKELVEKLDIPEDEAERIIGMNGKCTHSAWLTFMYPRLALARELLRDDGVIFISIDDNEQANLKRLCDEIFGEGNFVCNIIVRANSRGQTYTQIAKTHEYLFVIAKSENTELFELVKDAENSDLNLNDSIGSFNIRELRNRNPKFGKHNRPALFYPIYVNANIVDKDGFSPVSLEKSEEYNIEVYPYNSEGKESCWRWGETKSKNNLSLDTLNCNLVGRKKSTGEFGIYEKYRKTTYKPKSVWDDNNFLNETGTVELKKLGFNSEFDFPKPIGLIGRCIQLATSSENSESESDYSPIILDFFSGSGTTAHSVMKLNSEDGGKRKFILVQIDEPVKKGSEAEKAGFRTIDQIGRERIRRAAEKIKSENPNVQTDLEFKTYYLKSMPQNTLDKIKTFDPEELFTSDGDIVKSLGEKTLLQTWQVKDGFGFNCAQQKIDIAGCTAYLLEDEKIGKYLYLLTEMQEKSIKELIRKIETFELTVDKVFVYGYSFDFNSLTSLSANLKTLKNRNPLEPIIRY